MTFPAGQTFSFLGRDKVARAEQCAALHGPARVRVIAPGRVKLLIPYTLQPASGPGVLTPAAEALLASS